MLSLALALGLHAVSAAAPLEVLVVVPLCDGAQLACGNDKLGDPRSLDENLYWGAMYGADRFLAKRPGFRVVERKDAPDSARPALLRQTLIERAAASKSERAVRVRLVAFDGERIDDALTYFVEAVRGRSADLVVWNGHDRLMDVSAPTVTRSDGTAPANVAVLACVSEQYFGPVLDAMGARSVALTKSFMAPEGYLLEALVANVAKHGPADREHLRTALVAAYAKYQKISTKAAGTVFSTLK